MTVILGLDPGSINTGYGIVKKEGSKITHVASGVITVKGSDVNSRLPIIFTKLQEVIATYKPDHCVVEQVFISHNPQTGVKLGMARGVAILAASLAQLIIFELSARQAKKFVTGRGDADKALVNKMVVRFLKLEEAPKLDTSDALALAISHAQTLNARQMLLKQQSNSLLDEKSQKRLLNNALNFNALAQAGQGSIDEALDKVYKDKAQQASSLAERLKQVKAKAGGALTTAAGQATGAGEVSVVASGANQTAGLTQTSAPTQPDTSLQTSASLQTSMGTELGNQAGISDEHHWLQSQLSNIKINDKRFGFRTGKEKNRKTFEVKLKNVQPNQRSLDKVAQAQELAKAEASALATAKSVQGMTQAATAEAVTINPTATPASATSALDLRSRSAIARAVSQAAKQEGLAAPIRRPARNLVQGTPAALEGAVKAKIVNPSGHTSVKDLTAAMYAKFKGGNGSGS